MSCFPFWCPLVLSCVACPVSYIAVVVAVIVVFFCGIAVFVPLPFCLYPVFCPLTWGRCLGCGCGFAWFVGGFLGSCFCPAGVCTLVFVPCCWVVFA